MYIKERIIVPCRLTYFRKKLYDNWFEIIPNEIMPHLCRKVAFIVKYPTKVATATYLKR